MSEKSERSNWAWERIEALADDSLDAADRQRMNEALRADPALSAAVERARAVRAHSAIYPARPCLRGCSGGCSLRPFPRGGGRIGS